MHVYPSILTDSIREFTQQLDWVIAQGKIEVVQVDIIDGFFADNLTITPADLAGLDFQDVKLDFHFMVNEPMDYVHELIEFEHELPVRAVIAQVERMSHQADFLEEVHQQKWEAGISLDLDTPVTAINQASWKDLDIVQLMTIQAGFQGQSFSPRALNKISEIKQLMQPDTKIIVDGGVKTEQLNQLHQLGVEGVTVGSAFWRTNQPVQAIEQFYQLAHA